MSLKSSQKKRFFKCQKYVKSDKQSVILSGDKLSLPLMSAMCAQLLRSDSGSNGHQLDFGCEGLPLNGGNFQFDF